MLWLMRHRCVRKNSLFWFGRNHWSYDSSSWLTQDGWGMCSIDYGDWLSLFSLPRSSCVPCRQHLLFWISCITWELPAYSFSTNIFIRGKWRRSPHVTDLRMSFEQCLKWYLVNGGPQVGHICPTHRSLLCSAAGPYDLRAGKDLCKIETLVYRFVIFK